jgi:hypothetical protein
MRICAFLLIGLLSPLLLRAQARTLHGQLTDDAGQPLAYATAGIVGQPIGTVADAHGRFQLALPATVAATDSIRFGLVGYRPRTLVVAALPPSPLQIRLPEATLVLAEASVRAKGLRRQRIGNHNWNANMQTNFAISKVPGHNVGAEIGRVFQLPKGGAWLDTLRFAIANTFDSVRLRVNVYALEDGHPGRSLLQRPHYLTRIKHQRGWAIVDFRSDNLFVRDEAVVVALEWVSHSPQPEGILALPITVPAFGTHLYRYGAANSWKRFPGMSACLEIVVRY